MAIVAPLPDHEHSHVKASQRLLHAGIALVALLAMVAVMFLMLRQPVSPIPATSPTLNAGLQAAQSPSPIFPDIPVKADNPNGG